MGFEDVRLAVLILFQRTSRSSVHRGVLAVEAAPPGTRASQWSLNRSSTALAFSRLVLTQELRLEGCQPHLSAPVSEWYAN